MSTDKDLHTFLENAIAAIKLQVSDTVSNVVHIIHEQYGWDMEDWLDDLTEFESSAVVEVLDDELDEALSDTQKRTVFKCLRVSAGLEKQPLSSFSDDALKIIGLHDLDFTVTVDDVAAIRRKLHSQIPDFSNEQQRERTFFELQAVAHKNRVPRLVSLLNDLYHSWRFHRANSASGTAASTLSLSESDWIASSPYLSSKLGKKQQTLICHALASFNARISQRPLLNVIEKLDDSMADFVHTICSVSQSIHQLVQNKQALPLQIDVWIIPHNRHKSDTNLMMPCDEEDDDDDDDEDSDDDSEDDDDDDEKEDVLGAINIDELLKKDGTAYSLTDNMPDMNANAGEFRRRLQLQIEKVIDNQRSLRVCLIVDRRKQHGQKCPDVYCYKPRQFAQIDAATQVEGMLNNTKKYMLPYPSDNHNNNVHQAGLGAADTITKREFVLSFLLHEQDRIDMYLWMHGFCFRFLPQYCVSLLPMYFVKERNDLQKHGIDENYIDANFTLNVSDPLFDAWNKQICALDKI
eukprot:CAMPEP_0202691416 /NCGR_PEP_ID=MMETSP1385-20130828/6145_1 /ASSEMBLY_ACC=CAM_ASM_000861 /TAXON_ID=933848 /ORGANISM="Elphidium margaritaceum" /LENGTH=519 /DNA_ID=CAMNT_0049346819 /DNA_START=38 /DNA_END=1597 /DNA_ORIENTATION=+